MQPIPLPLYPFQRRGVARLLRSRRLLFADDMGLGKTIQTIAAIRLLLASGRIRNALVVAPATLIPNWLGEFKKWTPEIVVTRGGPARQDRNREWGQLMDQCHVVVTNYEDIRGSIVAGERLRLDLLVLDEAHRLKNWDSLATRAMRRIESGWKWALTGTPLERASEDFANLLAFLDQDAFTKADAGLPHAVLRSRASRFVLRRQKSEVMTQLPSVVRRHERIGMHGIQASAYRRAIASQSDDNPLADFNRLRTICDYDPQSGESAKINRVIEILSQVREAGEKAVVFSYLIEPLQLIRRRLHTMAVKHEVLVGTMEADEREASINSFKTGEATALLASMRVASEGLTLVEANHVLFVNRWWNPSLNQQATDRVVRIGQVRTVFVYSFTVEDTLEEELDRILESKEQLFDDLIGHLGRSSQRLSELLSHHGVMPD
ncbi:MAG: DEAD/DEAH box helicase [Gammaproteobacteria bacterium]|nr:DEAD/DEAH box helicase [Gammaproteobacteria bacterium]